MKIIRENAVFVIIFYVLSLAVLLYSLKKNNMVRQYKYLLKVPLLRKSYEQMGYEGYAKQWRYAIIGLLVVFSIICILYFIGYFFC